MTYWWIFYIYNESTFYKYNDVHWKDRLIKVFLDSNIFLGILFSGFPKNLKYPFMEIEICWFSS